MRRFYHFFDINLRWFAFFYVIIRLIEWAVT